MQCKKCGVSINDNSKFCTNCGTKINEEVQTNINNMQQPLNGFNNPSFDQQTMYQPNNQNYYNQPIKTNKEPLGTASLIVGIISIVLVWFTSIFIIPLAITGLILGIVNKKKQGKMISGIVLNSITLVINVLLIIIAIFILKSEGFNFIGLSNPIVGKYDCTDVDTNTDKYLVTLHLNKDNTFMYAPYGDATNNYAKGTYTYEDEHKTNGSGEYKYYMITLKGSKEDFVVNGNSTGKDFNAKMEFGIAHKDEKKQGVIMLVNTGSMYYCYEK